MHKRYQLHPRTVKDFKDGYTQHTNTRSVKMKPFSFEYWIMILAMLGFILLMELVGIPLVPILGSDF